MADRQKDGKTKDIIKSERQKGRRTNGQTAGTKENWNERQLNRQTTIQEDSLTDRQLIRKTAGQ